jgi:hypothetical protein
MSARRVQMSIDHAEAAPQPASSVEARLRVFLFAVAAASFAGTMAELWLSEHTSEWMQLVPFALCGVGVASILAAMRWPSRRRIWAVRVVMIMVTLAGILGVYEHLAGNYEFERDIRPNAAMSEIAYRALHGAAPALAPLALALVASLAAAATYAHPALAPEE